MIEEKRMQRAARIRNEEVAQMSKESVEAIVGKAVLDSEFREELFADPEKVLAKYELTEEEVAALRAIDLETMESFAGTLDERISKMILSPFRFIDGLTSLQAGLSGTLVSELQQDAGETAADEAAPLGGGGSTVLKK
jgi:hypothetical protein